MVHFGEVAVPAADDTAVGVRNPTSRRSAYVAFAAQYEAAGGEAVVVDASTVVLSQAGQEARQAWAV